MKKGQRISKILIDKDHITVYDTEGCEVKLTRTQRHIFKHYNAWNFMDKLTDEFGRSDVMDPHYCVIKDGEIVVSNE